MLRNLLHQRKGVGEGVLVTLVSYMHAHIFVCEFPFRCGELTQKMVNNMVIRVGSKRDHEGIATEFSIIAPDKPTR